MDSKMSRVSRVTLNVGQTFESWVDLKKAIVDEGARSERVLVTLKKDKYKWKVRCRMNEFGNAEKKCPWRLRATYLSRTETITITVAELNHSCKAADHYSRRMHSNSDRLADKIMDIILKNRQTRASFQRDSTQALIHPDIKYHTAYAAKRRCLTRLDGDSERSFSLIPSWCQHVLDRDPGAVAKWSAVDKHFETVFICPSASREAYRHCCPMIALDGTHTRSTHPGILLLETTLDADDTVIVLAFSWVPVENTEYWMKFLELLRDAIPNLCKQGTVFISDREKGLQEGVPTLFPHSYPAYCTWHLGENVQKHHGKEMKKLFEKLPYATTPERFERRLEKIREACPAAADYIKGTADPKYYSRAFFPAKRWGHESSQQAESMNRVFKPQRQEVPLNCCIQVWDYIMAAYFDKREKGKKWDTPFCPNIMSALREVEEEAFHLIAHPSTRSEVRVTDEIGGQYIVLLSPEWSCTCGDFQDKMRPCKHAWRALTALKLRHFDYVSPCYNLETYRKTYEAHLPALVRDGLQPNENCGPSLKQRKAGRPTERVRMQFQDEEVCRLPRKCGVCNQRGHDRRNCPEREAARAARLQRSDATSDDGVSDTTSDDGVSDSEIEEQ